MGLPGMIGALGACFGKVVTMDSPKARPPGTFNWAATLWHELAHVITLQMSGNRLPRWLSEGISMFEETRARPGWGRESELLFAQAYAGGRLLPLADLNSGFAKVETINLAYQEAAVLVAYLVETHGDEKLRQFVRSFGEGLDDEAALTRAYGRTWVTLQPEFDAYVKQKYEAVVPALTEIDDTPPGRTATAADWVAFADKHAGNFRVQMAAATPLLRLGDLDATRRGARTGGHPCALCHRRCQPVACAGDDGTASGQRRRCAAIHGEGARRRSHRRRSRYASSWPRRRRPKTPPCASGRRNG